MVVCIKSYIFHTQETIKIVKMHSKSCNSEQVKAGRTTTKQRGSNLKSNILLGDVTNCLKTLGKKHKFDVIIADPPYNIGKDFGNNNDSMQINEYIKWSKQWIQLSLDLLDVKLGN